MVGFVAMIRSTASMPPISGISTSIVTTSGSKVEGEFDTIRTVRRRFDLVAGLVERVADDCPHELRVVDNEYSRHAATTSERAFLTLGSSNGFVT